MKNTVGQISTELKASDSGIINPQEIQRAQEKEYLDNLVWAVKHARKELDCSDVDGHSECKSRAAFEGAFYIAAIIKKEKLLDNVIRNYFIPSKTCPTPCCDQTVYRYNDTKGDIEYLWTVPDQETALTLLENKDIVVRSEQHLLQFVLDYYSGKLLRLCKKLNGEKMHAGIELEGK